MTRKIFSIGRMWKTHKQTPLFLPKTIGDKLNVTSPANQPGTMPRKQTGGKKCRGFGVFGICGRDHGKTGFGLKRCFGG